MDLLVAAVVMGIVQGLTEFLPVSSSGHLILTPFLLGGVLPGLNDPFIKSLSFSVIVSVGTLGALLVYFARDWVRIVPAFFAALRDRSLASDPDRRLAVLLAVATVPALVLGFLLHQLEDTIREPGLVTVTLLIGRRSCGSPSAPAAGVCSLWTCPCRRRSRSAERRQSRSFRGSA